MERNKVILLLESEDLEFQLFSCIAREFSNNVELYRVTTENEMLDFLANRGVYENNDRVKRPSLIIMDLDSVGEKGKETIGRLKEDNSLKTIPIIILTSSTEREEVDSYYGYGVNSYLIKPPTIEEIKIVIGAILDYWFAAVVLPDADLQG